MTSPEKRHVLVARLDSIGDVLVTGPAIRAVAADPRVGTVTMVCGPQGRPAAELLPGVDEIITWASPWNGANAVEVTAERIAELREAVAGRGITDAVIFTSFHQSPLPLALVLRLAGVGVITGASVDTPGTLLDNRLRPGEDLPEDQPEVHRALQIAQAAGYTLPADEQPRMRVTLPSGSVPDAVARYVPDLASRPCVVVHPGADAPSRTWPEKHCAETVRRLVRRGLRVLVTGGPGETALTARVAGDHGVDLGGLLELRDLAIVLARAQVLIAGNTGPAHLSAAVGTPVVSLFSPVVPAVRWAPLGVPVELLGDQSAPCRGTRARLCPVAGHPCLSSVTPDQVVAATNRLLTTASTASRNTDRKGATV